MSESPGFWLLRHDLVRTVTKVPRSKAIIYDHHGSVVWPLMTTIKPVKPLIRIYSLAKEQERVEQTCKEGQHEQDDIPPPRRFFVLPHSLIMRIGLLPTMCQFE